MQKIAALIGILFLGAVLLAAYKFLTTPEEIDLEKLAQTINQEAKLPSEVIPGLRVEQIKAQNNQLVMRYTLTEYDGITIQSEVMQQVKRGMTDFMCSSFNRAPSNEKSRLREQIEKQAIAYYIKLYNKNNVFLHSATVNLTTCFV